MSHFKAVSSQKIYVHNENEDSKENRLVGEIGLVGQTRVEEQNRLKGQSRVEEQNRFKGQSRVEEQNRLKGQIRVEEQNRFKGQSRVEEHNRLKGQSMAMQENVAIVYPENQIETGKYIQSFNNCLFCLKMYIVYIFV